MADQMGALHGILLGLGLKDLPKLMKSFQQAQTAEKNLREGRAHDDNGPSTQDQAQAQQQPDAYTLQSVLAPLLAQMQGQGGGDQQPMPVNTPMMRPGMPPTPLPRMQGLPRTMQAGASPSGF